MVKLFTRNTESSIFAPATFPLFNMEISGQKCPYVSSGEVCYQILTDKYSKLVVEAKRHDDPELYIERKYY